MTDAIIKKAFDELADDEGNLPLCKLKELVKSLGIDCKEFKGQKCRREMREMVGGWDTDGDRNLSWEEFKEGPMIKIKGLLESE